jgi:hypothetical protein
MDQNFRRYLVDHRKGQLEKETPLSMSKAPLKEKPNIIGKVLGGIAGSKNKSFWTCDPEVENSEHGMLLVSDNRRLVSAVRKVEFLQLRFLVTQIAIFSEPLGTDCQVLLREKGVPLRIIMNDCLNGEVQAASFPQGRVTFETFVECNRIRAVSRPRCSYSMCRNRVAL